MADEFRINTAYAEKYNKWREKEELQKLKDRYGDVEEDDDSSSSESEDENAEALTDQLEIDWQRTLAAIKKRDPKIYDKNCHFYQKPVDSDVQVKKEKKEKPPKPMYLKDYERKVILEKGGKLDDDEDDDGVRTKVTGPSYYEEQEEIRQQFIDADENDENDDDEGLLTTRQKTSEEEDADKKDYEKWSSTLPPESTGKLAGREPGPLDEIWKDENLDEGGKFLRDYLMNKRYLEEETTLPTYAEIVDDGPDLSDEEDDVDKQETFERKYNFRFEEPDAEFIKSYPRTLAGSVRRKDERRILKRQETKTRKLQEKARKREELNQLKNLKRREILAKIEQLKEVTGNATVGFSEGDIADDFDPAAHDALMQKMFDNEYYGADEGAKKPKFAEDEELDDEDWDHWQRPAEGDVGDEGYHDNDGNWEADCEQDDFNMDADYHPEENGHSGILGIKSKKGKKKNKLTLALERQKPVFDPAEKTFEEYFDEYYQLDYEDIIGDMPCRFKYRKVVENDFGLTTDEILKAKDKELNAWVSVKKMSQYRTEAEEKMDLRKYRKKSRNSKLKYNTLVSLQPSNKTEDDEPKKRKRRKKKGKAAGRMSTAEVGDKPQRTAVKPQKRKAAETETETSATAGKKKKKRKLNANADVSTSKSEESSDGKAAAATTEQWEASAVVTETKPPAPRKKSKKKKKRQPSRPIITDERLKAYGINPKKFKYGYLPTLGKAQ